MLVGTSGRGKRPASIVRISAHVLCSANASGRRVLVAHVRRQQETDDWYRFDQHDQCELSIACSAAGHPAGIFAAIAAVDKLKSAHRASLAKLDALFASLQHRSFRENCDATGPARASQTSAIPRWADYLRLSQYPGSRAACAIAVTSMLSGNSRKKMTYGNH